jgi:hypothetical protein
VKRNAYRIQVGNRGERQLGRPRHSWEDNVKMDLREMEWGVWAGFIWLRIRTSGGLS